MQFHSECATFDICPNRYLLSRSEAARTLQLVLLQARTRVRGPGLRIITLLHEYMQLVSVLPNDDRYASFCPSLDYPANG